MSSFLKSKLNLLYPIATTIILIMCLLMLSRISLALWQIDRVNETSGWLSIIVNGLRIDVATLSILFLIPAVLSCFIASDGKLGRTWLFVLRIRIVISIWITIYLELATPPFIMEYDVRPNRLFVEYLKYPKEVFSMLLSGYKPELLIGFIGSFISIFFGWKFSKTIVTDLSFPKWYWRPVLTFLVLILALAGGQRHHFKTG